MMMSDMMREEMTKKESWLMVKHRIKKFQREERERESVDIFKI